MRRFVFAAAFETLVFLDYLAAAARVGGKPELHTNRATQQSLRRWWTGRRRRQR